MARLHSVVVSIALSFATVFLPSHQAQAQLLDINPFLTCIEPTAGGFIANFGYESYEDQPSSIFIGPDNFFTPAPGNRGQISLFFKGYHPRAFRIEHQTSSGSILTWNLQGPTTAIASVNSPVCDSALNFPPVATLAVNGGGGQSAPINTNFPALLSIRATVEGRPLRGLGLTFVAPASGASATFTKVTVNTDENGLASVVARANGVAGTYTVTVFSGAALANALSTTTLQLTNQ
jgi:hypothetical protein